MQRKGTTFATAGVLLALLGAMSLAGGCASDAQTGAGIGALIGAASGAIIGDHSGRGGEGAAIGAAVGAGAGYIIGNESDKAKHRRYEHEPVYYEPDYRREYYEYHAPNCQCDACYYD